MCMACEMSLDKRRLYLVPTHSSLAPDLPVILQIQGVVITAAAYAAECRRGFKNRGAVVQAVAEPQVAH